MELKNLIAEIEALKARIAALEAADQRGDQWLTAKDASDVARVSPQKISRYCNSGELKASKIGGSGRGGSWRIRRSDLDAFIEGGAG